MDDERDGTLRFRTIWISDLHLGTAGCQARLLLEFLRHTESEYLYLVGDIIDGWQLRRRWYWPQVHNDVVQKILRKARKGTSVIFIPGNHDEFGRHFLKLSFGGIEVREEVVHVTADGRTLLALSSDAVLSLKIGAATRLLATPVKVASLSGPISIAIC